MAGSVPFRLGDTEFSLEAGPLQEWQRQESWVLDRQEPVDGFGVGAIRRKGSDQLRLTGVSFPGSEYGNAESVSRLRAQADTREPQLLVDGEGNVYGSWLIISLSERRGNFTPTGRERRAEWELTLEPEVL